MTDSITAKDRAGFQHPNLAAALAAFQAEVPKMSKDETAKVKSDKANYSYGYATLDQFVEIVEPVLGKHGLSVTSKTTFVDGRMFLEVSLLHESGERETGFWPLPDPLRVGPQDLGSAFTYGRRYLGWALTGTFPGGVDDDGAKAQQTARESWDNAQPRQQAPQQPQQQKPPAKDWTKATDAEIHEQHTKLGNLDLEKAGKLYDWMAKAGIHNRKVDYVGGDMLDATQVLAFRLADLAAERGIKAPEVAAIRDFAEGRGLMKVLVTGDTSLGEELGAAAAISDSADGDVKPPPPDNYVAETD